MEHEEQKFAILEKLVAEIGEKQTVNIRFVEKFAHQFKSTANLTLNEIIDYLSASGITVTGHHSKVSHDDPLAMYFHDISKVEILGKERELELANDMRQILHNFHSTIASMTLSVKKFIVLGEKLKNGAFFVDEFSITSLRPDEQSPAEHRQFVLDKYAELCDTFEKALAAKKNVISTVNDDGSLQESNAIYFKQILSIIDDINPSMKIIDSVLTIFERLKRFIYRHETRFDEYLLLAGLNRDDALKLFHAPNAAARQKLAQANSLGEKALTGVLRECRNFLRVRARIDAVSFLPTDLLKKNIEDIPENLIKYDLSRERLVKANVRLVINIARNYLNQGVDLLDLIQEGNHALLKAIERFDPSRGYKLATYAIWWIRQSMIRCIAEQGHVIRLPAHLIQWARKYSRAFQQLSQELGREPETNEIAEYLDISQNEIDTLLQALQGQVSLDKKVGFSEDSRTLADFIEDDKSTPPSLMATLAVLQNEIDRILTSLTKREADVIALRFGLRDNYPRTLDEIGRMFNLSRERIRQIENRALAKLRHPSRARVFEAFLND